MSERIYPQSWVACVLVWCLDRLPLPIMRQVINSYWSDADVELARIKGARLHYELTGECDSGMGEVLDTGKQLDRRESTMTDRARDAADVARSLSCLVSGGIADKRPPMDIVRQLEDHISHRDAAIRAALVEEIARSISDWANDESLDHDPDPDALADAIRERFGGRDD